MIEPVVDAPAPGRCPVAHPPAFPMARQSPLDPPPEYAQLRESEPVAKVRLSVSGKEVWVVSRYESVKHLLKHPQTSSNWKLAGYPLPVALPEEILRDLELPLVAMDPPDHSVRRRALIPEFTVRRIQAMRPRIQEIVDERIDAMLERGGPLDLVEALALPVPSLLFCELLGVPASDTDFFRRYAELMVDRSVSQEQLGAAQYEMEIYLDKLVTEKTQDPTDDLLSRMISRCRTEGVLGHPDFVALARNLLFGGFDTTANMISLGVVALLTNPDQLAALRSDPALAPKAVEELLRYLSISDSATARVATADIEVDGTVIKAGEGMILLNGSANRDSTVFADPDTLDVTRDARGHAAFGHGIHQCIGANLVRVELEVVFTTLFRRIPTLRIDADLADLAFKTDALIYGMYELPVSW